MTLPIDFIPSLPFEGFKWKWASVAPTEGLNDPVVLLGVLFRMRRLENRNLSYSSQEFADELADLAEAIQDRGITGVDLARRTGERNLIRNSGQYWKALGLIPIDSHGIITLTDFGRNVADRVISQSEFAALTIRTFLLPNPAVQSDEECRQWRAHHIELHPLLLLLRILRQLNGQEGQGYLTKQELLKIIMPLSAVPNASVDDYVNFIVRHRNGLLDLSRWPNCQTRDNDHRIGREFLLFLANYGYVDISHEGQEEQFVYNQALNEEISEIIGFDAGLDLQQTLDRLRNTAVTEDIERIRVQKTRARPNQARFRRAILTAYTRCVITNVTMPEVLEAAHIVPVKYNGEDTTANGFCMRMDIHLLFDAGHLRVNPDGDVELSQRARLDYGALIPPHIHIPAFVSRDFLRWRWENYNGI
ncbi:MAG: HNH endonuclease [Victivallales bacterium]|nr:HNH endonuclease [Victivallales bacterium]